MVLSLVIARFEVFRVGEFRKNIQMRGSAPNSPHSNRNLNTWQRANHAQPG
jgi:hypothetical protein